MHDIPLNETQRIFADKNHNLVYKFLHEKNLPASEYYDIVIFGYLRAVQRYLADPNLAGYSFSTVAWRAMEGEVVNTHRTDKRRFRVIRFVRPRQSYTGHLTWRSTPTVTDEEALRESEVALLLQVKVAKDEKLSMDERYKAVDALNKIVPQYNATIDKTTKKFRASDKALKAYINNLVKLYEVQGAKKQIQSLAEQRAELEVKLAGAKKNLSGAKSADRKSVV